jgi:phenylalanine-4-hydroxylase
MTDTLERIPAHLRRYVASQDYEAYDEIDHAVWRFVLLQTYARLGDSAHPAYRSGLAETGISVERIPRIQEMDACLAEYGWGAVCVDGFIPPRAFQEFQALGIMTIAGAIRSQEHLAYTPAPDIIHESAGHAPIVPDPVYRDYLQRIGRAGARAFSSPADGCVHDAIRKLSALREDEGASQAELERAEAELAESTRDMPSPSEASRLARLHWWTVEYGLVGRPDDYRIYGAGLLSSLGESFFCHDPSVRKLPLDRSCIGVDYDITKPQPQLFVAESFDHLNAVLEDVMSDFAQMRGGAGAIEAAERSAEIATLVLDSGLQVSGRIAALKGDAETCLFEVAPGWGLARNDELLEQRASGALVCPLGPLVSGQLPSRLPKESLVPGPVELVYRSGISLRGTLVRSAVGPRGCLEWLDLRDVSLRRGGVLLSPPRVTCALALGASVMSGFAGPADPRFWPDSEFGAAPIPRQEAPSAARASLRGLYDEALELWRAPHMPGLVPGLLRVAEALRKDFPEDWLLRWNLLECLGKVDHGLRPACELRDELLEIESRHPRDAPISMGLRYLGLDPPARHMEEGTT